MDLDNSTSGFKYVMDGVQLKLTIPTGNAAAKKTGAEGDTLYGEIAVNNIRLYAESAYGIGDYSSTGLNLKWDDVVAKLVMGPLSIGIKGGASTTINYEGNKSDSFWLKNAYDYPVYKGRYGSDDQTAAKANSWESWNQVQFDVPGYDYAWTTNYGIYAKYVIASIADLQLDIASFKAWDDTSDLDSVTAGAQTRFDTGDQGDNAYAGRFTANITAVPNLTAKLGANFGFGYTDASGVAVAQRAIALGAQLGYGIAIGEDIKITPAVGLDYGMVDPEAQFSLAGGLTAEIKGAKIVANVGWADLPAANDSAMAYTITAVLGPLVPNLTAQAFYEAVDASMTATNNDTMAVGGKIGYKIMANETVSITPSVTVTMDNKDDATNARWADTTENDLYVKAGVDIGGLLDNTTFSINWDSCDLQNDAGYVATGAASNGKLGQLVFTVKVSF
jgi:hypothetical protein